MGISLKPEHLKRYKDITWLFMKYGRADLVKKAGLEEALIPDDEELALQTTDPKAEELAKDLEKMGPTFIKLGQLLSTRADLLEAPYMEALARLQDNVEPFPYEEVERIVTTELGVRISKAFSVFDPSPVAAASLGQVHRAVTRNGRPVAVKVQRPNIREGIVNDLDALEEIAAFLDAHTDTGKRYEFQNMLRESRKSLLHELDYRLEAHNLSTLGENLKEFERIVVPQPVEDYSTSRLLTIDYIQGKKITSLTPLALIEVDRTGLAEDLFRAYLKQILVDGFFHADPHPGNVFLTDDGRIALLDLGMVARIAPKLQEQLLKLLLAISEGRSNEAADIAIEIGQVRDYFDEPEFRRRIADFVGQHQDTNIQRIEVGKVVLALTRTAAECGVAVPPELTMLGKTLLNLDQVGRTLDPHFNPNASIRKNSAEIMRQHMLKTVSPSNIFTGVMEMTEFVERLPGRINRILDAVAKNEIKLKVDAIDEGLLIDGLQKIANRITLGLILAALIVGAALLMRVETSFRIMGYPGFAILCFMLAAGGGIAFVLSILFYDENKKKH